MIWVDSGYIFQKSEFEKMKKKTFKGKGVHPLYIILHVIINYKYNYWYDE